MKLRFTKMQGLGNDFVFIDDRDGRYAPLGYPSLAQKLCHRHFGIGGDGLILVLASATHDLKFRIFNADGSEAQMCGNGMRCFAKYVIEKGILVKDSFHIETLAGTIKPEVIKSNGLPGESVRVQAVRVDMGPPILDTAQIPFVSDHRMAVQETLQVASGRHFITPVSMGNPHAVLFVDDVENIPLETLGAQIEVHPRFPQKTNVEFIEVVSDTQLKMRVWERGVGETLACGTGACAALVAAVLNKKAGREAVLTLRGGELTIEWDQTTNHVFKTGPAEVVFEGETVI